MNIKPFVAFSLVAISGAAASQDLSTVEVRGNFQISLACLNPTAPARVDVERILHITDVTQTSVMRRKLMHAADEACKAGYAKIAVTRGVLGQGLTWKPVQGDERIAGAPETVKVAVLTASR